MLGVNRKRIEFAGAKRSFPLKSARFSGADGRGKEGGLGKYRWAALLGDRTKPRSDRRRHPPLLQGRSASTSNTKGGEVGTLDSGGCLRGTASVLVGAANPGHCARPGRPRWRRWAGAWALEQRFLAPVRVLRSQNKRWWQVGLQQRIPWRVRDRIRGRLRPPPSTGERSNHQAWKRHAFAFVESAVAPRHLFWGSACPGGWPHHTRNDRGFTSQFDREISDLGLLDPVSPFPLVSRVLDCGGHLAPGPALALRRTRSRKLPVSGSHPTERVRAPS